MIDYEKRIELEPYMPVGHEAENTEQLYQIMKGYLSQAREYRLKSYDLTKKAMHLQLVINNGVSQYHGLKTLKNGLFNEDTVLGIVNKANGKKSIFDKHHEKISSLMKSLKFFLKRKDNDYMPLTSKKNVIILLKEYQQAIVHALHDYETTDDNIKEASVKFCLGTEKLKRLQYNNKVIKLYNQNYSKHLKYYGGNHHQISGLNEHDSRIINGMHDYYKLEINAYTAAINNGLSQDKVAKAIKSYMYTNMYNRVFSNEPDIKLDEKSKHYNRRTKSDK